MFNDVSLGNPSTHHFSFSQYNTNLYTSDSIFTSTNKAIRYHPIRKKQKNISAVHEIKKHRLFLLTSCKSIKSLLWLLFPLLLSQQHGQSLSPDLLVLQGNTKSRLVSLMGSIGSTSNHVPEHSKIQFQLAYGTQPRHFPSYLH